MTTTTGLGPSPCAGFSCLTLERVSCSPRPDWGLKDVPHEVGGRLVTVHRTDAVHSPSQACRTLPLSRLRFFSAKVKLTPLPFSPCPQLHIYLPSLDVYKRGGDYLRRGEERQELRPAFSQPFRPPSPARTVPLCTWPQNFYYAFKYFQKLYLWHIVKINDLK